MQICSDLQPVDLLTMRQTEDKLIHNPIHTNCSTNQLKRCIIGVGKDEMMEIEIV